MRFVSLRQPTSLIAACALVGVVAILAPFTVLGGYLAFAGIVLLARRSQFMVATGAGIGCAAVLALNGPGQALTHVFGIALAIVLGHFFGRDGRAMKQSDQDHVTGLLTWRGALMEAEKVLVTHDSVSVAVIDLDGFKAINDRHGHSKGNEVLRVLGTVISGAVPSGSVTARYGGDEFVLVLPGQGMTEAHETVQNIRRSLERSLANEPFRVTVSTGIAMAGRDGDSLQELFDRADQRLFRGRDVARNYHCAVANF